jgi:hypothetical protein
MILNESPNRQVLRILMDPRPIFSNRSENDPGAEFKIFQFNYNCILVFFNFLNAQRMTHKKFQYLSS